MEEADIMLQPKAFMISFLLFACVGLWSSGQASVQQDIPADTVITLERTGCFGSCPIYKLTIVADGSVAFEGRDYVRSRKMAGRITREQLRELISAFEEIDFSSSQFQT